MQKTEKYKYNVEPALCQLSTGGLNIIYTFSGQCVLKPTENMQIKKLLLVFQSLRTKTR